MLAGLPQYPRIRRGGLRSRLFNSVSRLIRSSGLRFRSTNTVLQRSHHESLDIVTTCLSRPHNRHSCGAVSISPFTPAYLLSYFNDHFCRGQKFHSIPTALLPSTSSPNFAEYRPSKTPESQIPFLATIHIRALHFASRYREQRLRRVKD